jgi:hypothetical protein
MLSILPNVDIASNSFVYVCRKYDIINVYRRMSTIITLGQEDL